MDAEDVGTEDERIHVTRLNIRPSIFMVLLQQLFLNTLSFTIIITGYLLILNYGESLSWVFRSTTGLILIVAVFLTQLFLTLYGFLGWTNEYYELTPKLLVHKKGIIFRQIQKSPMEYVRYMNVEQGLLGKIFDFGTISFYDQRKEKLMDLNYIHNPEKYLEVFERLHPDTNALEHVIRGEENMSLT